MKYIILIENELLRDWEVLGQTNKKNLKDVWEFYKKEYPNTNLRVFEEVRI